MKEKKKTGDQNSGFLFGADKFFTSRRPAMFWLASLALLLFALLLFQANISIGGDDSFYIMRAQKLLTEGKYPTFQGPLYPIVLTPFIAIFGLEVHILKTLSILFTLIFLFLFYVTYKDRISPTILVLSLFVLVFNSQILYYASQTYNEAFHLMIQMLFFYQFFRVYKMLNGNDAVLKEQYMEWLKLGLTMFLLTLSKNIGLVGILTVSGFFLIQGKWKSLGISVASFALFAGLYAAIKRLMFDSESQISKQGMMLLYKDPYNFSKGKEDLAGYINRFIENSNVYLSKNLMKVFNLRDAKATDSVELITILLGILVVYGLFVSYRKNKYVFFTASYLTITLAATFVILQTRWDQDRLIFLIVPFFCVFALFVLDELLRKSRFKLLQPLFMVVMFLYLSSNVIASSKNIDLLRLKKNLSGDKYLGYTMDWQNYLKISEWAGKNLPETSFVAARKAAMSSLYAGGKDFFNVSRVISEDADSLLDNFQQNKVSHVILAKLRRNPLVKSELTINTVDRYLALIERKYPGTFRAIHMEGQRGNEEAVLFEINYNVRERAKNQP